MQRVNAIGTTFRLLRFPNLPKHILSESFHGIYIFTGTVTRSPTMEVRLTMIRIQTKFEVKERNMTRSKIFTIATLVMCLAFIAAAEKREKKMPMKELTDPASPSYVPIPYPKTEEEIIVDFKYAIKKVYELREGVHVVNLGPPLRSREILLNLLEEKSEYKIGKIVKVNNRNANDAHDYSWLVIVLNKDNSVAARVDMAANGLWGGTLTPHVDLGPQFLETEEKMMAALSNALGKKVAKKNMKKVERIALKPPIGTLFYPAWHVTLSDGEDYYYSVGRKKVYKVSKKIPWKKDKKGDRQPWVELVPHQDFAFDTVNDQLLIFEKIEKKK